MRVTSGPRHFRPILSRQNVGYLGYDFHWLHTPGVSAPSACSSLSLGGVTVSSDRELPPAIRFNPSPHASNREWHVSRLRRLSCNVAHSDPAPGLCRFQNPLQSASALP